MRRSGVLRSILLASGLGIFGAGANAAPFTINDALRMAVQTNPSIGEAAANKRATEAELRQVQSTLLPQVRLEASAGPERLNNPATYPLSNVIPTLNNGQYVAGAKGSIFVRQLLFDGFTSLHEIWRNAARVDAAAARTHERSELIALDASEAYIDVVRYTRLVALAQANVAAHKRIFGNVEQRFRGGRAGQGDLEQTRERVDAAEVALTEFRRSLEDARSKFRKVIGIEPYNLRGPGRLPGLPASKDRVLAVTLTDNPTIKAAQADSDAAREAFHSAAGAFMPIAEGGRSLSGGQKQAIGLARSLIRRPKALFLDEPTAHFDVRSEAEFLDRLKEIAADNMTILISTHRLSLLSFVDRILLFERGKLIADGPRDKVIAMLRGGPTKVPEPAIGVKTVA